MQMLVIALSVPLAIYGAVEFGYAVLRDRKRLRFILDGTRLDIADIQPDQQVVLHATLQTDVPLHGPLSAEPCAAYAIRITDARFPVTHQQFLPTAQLVDASGQIIVRLAGPYVAPLGLSVAATQRISTEAELNQWTRALPEFSELAQAAGAFPTGKAPFYLPIEMDERHLSLGQRFHLAGIARRDADGQLELRGERRCPLLIWPEDEDIHIDDVQKGLYYNYLFFFMAVGYVILGGLYVALAGILPLI